MLGFWGFVGLAAAAFVVAVIWSALADDQRRRHMARAYDKYRLGPVSDETRAHLAADDNNDNPDLL
jgi:hypothetical protein